MNIKNNIIEITRGNSLVLDVSIKNGNNDYTFQEGDIVGIAIYNRNGLNQQSLASKTAIATGGETTIRLSLTTTEMKIGQMQNRPITYWYEITLSGETVLGYDENGPKQLILYPEGADND